MTDKDFSAVASRGPLRLIAPLSEAHKAVGNYDPAEGLWEAMDVAMMLGEPLLLTGEPGTGKTRAAYWLADRLTGAGPDRFNVKSSTSGADLLYSFDEVARFREGGAEPLVTYLRFNPLGEGILRAAGGAAVLQTAGGDDLTGEALKENLPLLKKAFGPKWTPTDGAARAASLLPNARGFAGTGPEVRVVLIDEMDKAPRDTPNDLLAEVEDMAFLIPELGLRVVADPAVRPVVIITSNSEKALPEAFLRRCAYFDVPFPDDAALHRIVDGAVTSMRGGGRLVDEALEVLRELRSETSGVQRRPATPELLGWLETLARAETLKPGDSLRAWAAGAGKGVRRTLPALLKRREDHDAGERVIAAWARRGDG